MKKKKDRGPPRVRVFGTGSGAAAERAQRLGDPLALLGGDFIDIGPGRDRFPDALAWAPAFAQAIDEARAICREQHLSWLRMPPTMLAGERGVGRTFLARTLARTTGLSYAAIDVSMDSAASVISGGGRSMSLLAAVMAITNSANPLILVGGLERAADGVVDLIRAAIDPASSCRAYDARLGTTVDLSHINWLVQWSGRGDLPGPLSALLTPVWIEHATGKEALRLIEAVAREVLRDTAVEHPVEAIFAPPEVAGFLQCWQLYRSVDRLYAWISHDLAVVRGAGRLPAA